MSIGEFAASAAVEGDGEAPAGAALARRRGAPLALPAGAHAGQEDGQGDDLLAGALRLHARQLDADPPRPVGFGKFGKRGVGYNVDSLVGQIRRILQTGGQHNIALFGAGHLGKAIASSDIFADHGFNVVAIFDADARKIGSKVGGQTVRDIAELDQVVEEEGIVVGVLAVPTAAAQPLADALVAAGVRIIFNYSDALLDVPPEVTVHTSSPAVDLLTRSTSTYSSSHRPRPGRGGVRRVDRRDRRHRGGVRDPRRRRRSSSSPRFEELRDAGQEDDVLRDAIAGELISSEIEIRSGRGERHPRGDRAPARGARAGCSRSPPPAASRSARPARTRGPTTASSATSTPSTTGASSTACSTSPGATTRSRCTSTSASTAPTARCARCDRLRPVLPALLAVGANSPFLEGRDSGLHSARTQIFTKSFPRCGVPDAYGSWAGYR